jgi:hypothetical protein
MGSAVWSVARSKEAEKLKTWNRRKTGVSLLRPHWPTRTIFCKVVRLPMPLLVFLGSSVWELWWVQFLGFAFKTYIAYNNLTSTTVQACDEFTDIILIQWYFIFSRLQRFSKGKFNRGTGWSRVRLTIHCIQSLKFLHNTSEVSCIPGLSKSITDVTTLHGRKRFPEYYCTAPLAVAPTLEVNDYASFTLLAAAKQL